MEATAYVQLRKRLTGHHDYIAFLQIQPSTATSSKLVLAETLMSDQEPIATPDTAKLLSKMLLDQSVDTDKALENIGSVPEAHSSLECHRIFQDVGASWTVQNTLANLIECTNKFRTYIHLAAKASVSYMYWASLGTPHQYPRLIEYRYYGLASEDKTELKPGDVLEPYLSAGFGSRGTSGCFSGNEAMSGLGVLLHQFGWWKTRDEQDLNSTRETAKGKRNDLQESVGTPCTEVVDFCFTAKDVEWERHACAASIYKKVVAPLQKLVPDMEWD